MITLSSYCKRCLNPIQIFSTATNHHLDFCEECLSNMIKEGSPKWLHDFATNTTYISHELLGKEEEDE